MDIRTESFGLDKNVMRSLSEIFESTSEIDKVVIFGSRAKGNFLEGSDIDLSISGKAISFDTLLNLMDKVENLGLLYKIDILNHRTITDADVLEHIHQAGKIFWKRGIKQKKLKLLKKQ